MRHSKLVQATDDMVTSKHRALPQNRRTFTMNRLAAAALAIAVIVPAASVPAAANGQFSVHVAPTNGNEDRAMRTGLALYQMYRDVRGGASIIQRGRDNSAGVAQDGRDNLGVVS